MAAAKDAREKVEVVDHPPDGFSSEFAGRI
jgi:hypothetical protein